MWNNLYDGHIVRLLGVCYDLGPNVYIVSHGALLPQQIQTEL
jgi:hypothetical protein